MPLCTPNKSHYHLTVRDGLVLQCSSVGQTSGRYFLLLSGSVCDVTRLGSGPLVLARRAGWHGGPGRATKPVLPTLGLPPRVARGVMDLLYDLPSLWMVLDLLSLGMVMEPGQPAVPVQAARYLGR